MVGLRNYLDQRWFYKLLVKGNESYPEAILRAIIDGEREATFSLRCHVALPFIPTQARSLEGRHEDSQEDKERRFRTEEIQQAFNTPFWPSVLATTSFGHEGLDFHAWCDSLVHWDRWCIGISVETPSILSSEMAAFSDLEDSPSVARSRHD